MDESEDDDRLWGRPVGPEGDAAGAATPIHRSTRTGCFVILLVLLALIAAAALFIGVLALFGLAHVSVS